MVEHDGDGLRVRLLGWRDVSDLYDMRATLEGMAARLAATTGSQVERQVIGALCEEEGRLIAEGAEARALAEHNQKFHQAILKTANNQFLAESLSRLSRLTILLGHTVYSLPMRQHAIIQEHEDITQAILSQDGAQAEQMMRYHLERALQARLQIMSDGRE